MKHGPTYHILKMLKSHEHTSFHMPGHKANEKFLLDFPDAKYDITELPYSDNLRVPSGVIEKAEIDIANICKAKKSFITCGGSSSGIWAMLYAARQLGYKDIIFAKESHISVFNACEILHLNSHVVGGMDKNELFYSPNIDEIIDVLKQHKKCVVLITSPTYFGLVPDLDKIRQICDQYGAILIIDGAHGAHLVLFDFYAGKYADMWVDGFHKSLPTLTMGACVHVANHEFAPLVKEGLNKFTSTSPSYPIMASVEYGIKYFFIHQFSALPLFTYSNILSREDDLVFVKNEDWTKLVLDCELSRITPSVCLKLLHKAGIYEELSTSRYILFYVSINNTLKDIELLFNTLKDVPRRKRTIVRKSNKTKNIGNVSGVFEWVELEKSVGYVSVNNIDISPPCTPLIISGDIITKEIVAQIKNAKHVTGLIDNKILVIK